MSKDFIVLHYADEVKRKMLVDIDSISYVVESESPIKEMYSANSVLCFKCGKTELITETISSIIEILNNRS
jgi:hypothetical protein